ncbi:MAG TPA: OsmC family protein [Candidatus Cloacimonadota bacterium]|nr:OsmC family protein [Candidatus Cloacimonadota bacterium]
MEKLQAKIALINNGIKFSCQSGTNPEIITDYYPPLGKNEGYKPLEIFLISFGTCFSGTVLPILRSMKKTIIKYELNVSGIRREEHPTSFSEILFDFVIESPDIRENDLLQAIKLSEEKYCPVWAMVKNNVEVKVKYRIID